MFRIKKICKERGISLAELAERMGTSAESVSRALSENGNPTVKTLTKFSEALGVEVFELFENHNEDMLVRGYLEVVDKIHRINNFNDLETVYNKHKTKNE